MSRPDYDAADYWTERLEEEFSLKGTGHIAYSERYNRWLYRAKRRALQQALSNIGWPGRTLDIGSGTGWVINELIESGASVEGSDLTAVSVDRLRRSFPDVDFHQFALGRDRIPHPDGTFDLVTALDVLYHVPDDGEWIAGMQEIARVLRPGGHLVASDGLGELDQQPAKHVRFRSRARWEEQAERAGMEVTTVVPLYRWLSRDRSNGLSARIPDGVRGAVEYGLERLSVGRPHMRCAVLTRRPG